MFRIVALFVISWESKSFLSIEVTNSTYLTPKTFNEKRFIYFDIDNISDRSHIETVKGTTYVMMKAVC